MQNQEDSASNIDSSSNITVKVESLETPKKTEKKEDGEDPKPRIVLTFRSEKSGAKSTNMKIVTPEEKQEEVSPRRSSRTRHVSCLYEEGEFVSKRDKSLSSQPVSENDETSDNTHTPKRSTRGRSKECADTTSTRKEPPAPTQRLSRRIKPTAKILANEELRIGLESQNNARLGIQSEKPEEGVSTRRSGQAKTETTVSERRSSKRKFQEKEVKELEQPQSDSSVMKLKHLCELGLKAIQKSADEDDENSDDNENSESNVDVEGEDEEIDDDTEIINKLLEADEEWGGESSDDEYLLSEDNSQSSRPRRSRRLCPGFSADSDHSSMTQEEKPKSRPRRSSRRTVNRVSYEDDPMEPHEREDDMESAEPEFLPRRKKTRSTYESGDLKMEADDEENWDFAPKRKKNRTFEVDDKSENDEDNSNPAAADEDSEAAEPADASAAVATCFCEDPSNVYASPAELTEPVFCQAIEMVDGIRAGCSHPAMREAAAEGEGEGEGARGGLGDLAPLRRAGPRSPYFLACRLHTAQLAKHMCCPTCGLFCSQGIFYQCSKGHLFHAECGVLSTEAKLKPGCPHCGVTAYRWQPANRDCSRVQLTMHCSNERIYLPDQRVQCTPAYLTFSTSEKPAADPGPVIPEDLLPSLPVDLKKMCEDLKDSKEPADGNPVEELYEAIVNGEPVEQLIPKIVRGSQLDTPLEACEGGTCAHAAAARGRLPALVLLQCAGAALDAADAAGRTPLMRAILALLDKESPEEMEVDANEEPLESTEDKKEESEAAEPKESQGKKETQDNTINTDNAMEAVTVKQIVEVKEELAEEKQPEDEKEKAGEDKPSDEDVIKVIKYLVAASDVNLPGPEGMTALHLAAQHGGAEVCEMLVSGGAEVDARDQGGWTPLVRACEHNRIDVIRVLLRLGADPCSADPEGNAAAHWSALAGAAHALRLLLATAPHAALQANKDGDTPLHIAAREGHYPCVVMLLARGARPDAENSAGEAAMQVASGQCQAAISLNMQMAMLARGKLPRWKLLSSDISRGREPFPVECVNEVDDEPPPKFTYVSKHVMPEPIAIDNSLQAMQGCSCSEGGGGGECGRDAGGCECGELGVRRWYRAGRLSPAFPYHDPPMLFECNQTCACDLKRCSNHVVSRIEMTGSIGVPVTVFRTDRCGWGLRAKQRVPRGTPVALYCGELMPHAAADARDQDHYMFALHVKPDLLDQCGDKTQLCVDAARMGSCARFVNHSCAPNLAPVRVFTAVRDLRLPAVALFAVRDVPAGEELTFDYGDKFWAVKSKWMKCECGSPNCRYPTKSTTEYDS